MRWNGRTLVGSDGEQIGKISETYVDNATGKPEWATVSRGRFGSKSHFVPRVGASAHAEDVRAGVTRDQAKDAPSVERDGQLSEQEEQRLYEHYRVPFTTDGTTTAHDPARASRRPELRPRRRTRPTGTNPRGPARRPDTRPPSGATPRRRPVGPPAARTPSSR